MRNTLKILSLAIGISVIIAGCARDNIPDGSSVETASGAIQEQPVQESSVPVNITALNGPTGMGLAYLNKQSDLGNTKYKYTVSYASAPDEITGQLISGSIDIAAVPVNLAGVLYNKTEGEILTCAANTLGVLYIVEKGESVKSISDLAGKTIIASGQGSTPEYILNYLLEKNNLSGLVNTEYVSEHDEAVSALASGKADLIMIPEPKVTAALTQIEGSRIALDLTGEWSEIAPCELVQGVLVVRKAFADEHPEIMNEFLNNYKKSVEFTLENPAEASEIIAEYGIIPKPQLALKALPNCHIICLDGNDMKNIILPMLQILFDANPKSIGGKMPDENIFYMVK